MIGYISGKVLYAENGNVLLENNGVGYEIACSAEVYKKLLSEGKGEVYTYLAVREDDLSLYGFISLEEKQMFLKLISVSGVGPKMGIGILSCMNVSDLAFKIASEDVKGLSAVKGLGKKTAERIILELKEKMTDVDCSGVVKTSAPVLEEINDDALSVLTGLGFTKSESIKALSEAKNSGAETVEELISYALKHIK